jgi:hypothetical protein
MWGKAKSAPTEMMVHSWKQRDFDSVLKSITGDYPRLNFLIAGVSQTLQVNGDAFEPTPEKSSYLERKDFITSAANLNGMVYVPRVQADGEILVGSAVEIDAGFVGYANVECRDEPFVQFAVNVRNQKEASKLASAIQMGLLANKPVELSLKLAPIADVEEWKRHFIEKRYAPRLHARRVSISTHVGKYHPDATPIF